MTSREGSNKYREAASVLGQVTRARAEEVVRELVSAGDIPRGQAQEWVDNMVDRSRKTSEQLLETVRHEVAAQLKKIDASALESLASQVADLLKRSADAGRAATADVGAQAAKGAKAARAAAEKVTPAGRKKAARSASTRARAASKAAPVKKTAKKTAKRAAKKVAKTAPAKKVAKKAPAKKASTSR